ncbi:MAG: phosphatase PAP2 family protein [Eggerthella lenta]
MEDSAGRLDLMLVMGAARCYLVAHYPSDVLAGLLVGALAAVAAQLLVSLAFRRYGERRVARPRRAYAPVRRRR